jgi:hypothetical protein
VRHSGHSTLERYEEPIPSAPAQIAKAVNATVISLDQARRSCQDFERGVAKKFVLDPHGMLGDKQRIGA